MENRKTRDPFLFINNKKKNEKINEIHPFFTHIVYRGYAIVNYYRKALYNSPLDEVQDIICGE